MGYWPPASQFRSTPLNGHHQIGPGPFRAKLGKSRGLYKRRVDEPLIPRDLLDCARKDGTNSSVSQIVTHRKIPDATRRQKAILHELVEIADDLCAGG